MYQYPYGGAKVPAGSTVYLYTQTDQDAMTTVPDVVGKSGSFAQQMLQAANLNVQFEGDSGGKVTAQSVEANTSTAYGTIVTLTMEADSGTAAEEEPAAETQPEADSGASEEASGSTEPDSAA